MPEGKVYCVDRSLMVLCNGIIIIIIIIYHFLQGI